MSEFIVKTVQEWRHCGEELPEVGKVVEVLCTMTTKASLVTAEPQTWQQREDAEMSVDVKLWRAIDEPK